MNIQIPGTKKSADTRKAERFFKERNIRYQFVDLKEKGMGKGELTSVLQAVGGIDAVIDPDTKDQDAYDLIRYLADRIKADQKHPGVMLRMNKWEAMLDTAVMLKDGAITMDDLEDFSEDFRASVDELYQHNLSEE